MQRFITKNKSTFVVRTPNGQISEMLHYIEKIFNMYYYEIRFVVFHSNTGRYLAKFCFSSKTRVSHFRKSLAAAYTSLELCFDSVRTLVFRKIMTHHTISGVLSCYCTSVISRFSLFYDASHPRVTFQILVKCSCLKDGDSFHFKPSQTHNVVTAVSIQVPKITSDFLLVRWPHWSNSLVVWNTIARRLPKCNYNSVSNF